jgi:hypothetical protein
MARECVPVAMLPRSPLLYSFPRRAAWPQPRCPGTVHTHDLQTTLHALLGQAAR